MRSRLACLLAVALGAAAPAAADPEIRENTCAAYGDVVRALSIRFGELRRDGRVSGVDYDLELWSSVFGGWTTLMILPDGLTCVTTHGDLWERPSGPSADPDWTPAAPPTTAATAAESGAAW